MSRAKGIGSSGRLGDPVASTMVGPTLLAFAIMPLQGGSAR